MEKMEKKKKFRMPSAYVIIFFALFITIVLTYFIPVSIRDPITGEVVFNAMMQDGNILTDVGPQPKGLWDLLVAPILGFQSASDVGIALLIAGGFLNVLSVTGALEAGIGKMLSKLKGNVLIILMMLVTSLMGTVFGFWEEITAFSLVVVPMFLLAGYDVITGLAVLFVGASVGNMASVVNPFAAGAAVAAINNPALTLGSGIILRSIIYLVLYIVSTLFVLKYANSVKNDPSKSVVADLNDVATSNTANEDLPEMNRKRTISIGIFVAIVVVLLIGYVPWYAIGGEKVFNFVNAPLRFLAKIPLLGNILGASYITPLGDWGFTEFSFLFFLGSFLLLIVNKMKINDFTNHFLDGAKDLLGVVIVLSISRGIAVVMGDSSSGMSVTFVYWISNTLSEAPLWVFALFATLSFMLIGLFLQSTSGVAGISMPILGAVASALFSASNIGSTGGQIILISAFTIGLNFMTSIYPESVILGTLEFYNVPYDRYLKFMLKRMIPLLLIGIIIISLATYFGLAI